MSYWHDNSLAHFGILGQKWGVRRFQNTDGTLTEEGKRRYNLMESAKKEFVDASADHLGDIEGWKKRQKRVNDYYEQHPETSKAEQEKYLKEQFGNDWNSKSTKDYIKDVFENDDPYAWAQEEMTKEHKEILSNIERRLKESKAEAQIFMKRYVRLSMLKIEDLSKHDVEQLERFINRNMKNERFFLD